VAIGLEDKKQIVSEVNTAANSALSAVLADYRGVTVSDMTELRKIARENKVYLRVVRNTLLKKAVEGTEFECIQEVLEGKFYASAIFDEVFANEVSPQVEKIKFLSQIGRAHV
jgi:ribosomal protein L10